MSETAAVVLAGGAARRMGGTSKPLRPVGGVSLLERVLTAVPCAYPRVVVGPGELVGALPRRVSLTREHPPGAGPVAAVAAGMALLDGGPAGRPGVAWLVAVLAADLPFLPAETVRTLAEAAGCDGVDGAVVADGAGRPQWLCGVWRIEALRQRLHTLGHLAGRSMRELAAGLSVVALSPPADPGRPPVWFDCDTEGDLQQAEALLRSGG